MISLLDLKKTKLEGDIILYHGGLPNTITLDLIDCNHLGIQQNKRGKTYGGFYLVDESSRTWAEYYARQRNGTIHGFLIDSSSRISETNKVIDRLSQEEREGFACSFDLLKGKDLCGRIQYVLFNKSIIKNIGEDHIT